MARSRSTRPLRRHSQRGTSLVHKLTGSTALASYVKQLPAPAVTRLIEEIGLEDSHEIVALLAPEQMRAVLSVALWHSDRPGKEEVLDLDQFVRWLDLWMQDGEQTLAQRVLELGEDFVVMCLAKLLTAFDRTLVGIEDHGLEIGPYVLFPRREQHWHRIVAMLTILWHHEPDFVLHTLRRCAFERSVLNDDIREHGEADVLYEDIAADRTTERRGVGYVNPTHASLFLMATKTSEIEALYESCGYDLTTADYLSPMQAPIQEPTEPTASDEATADRARRTEEFATLDALLRDAGIIKNDPTVVALLTDQRGDPPRSELLEGAMALLAQSAPELATRRMRELAYLANVLMSGTDIQGGAFSEKAAAQAALATANLGLDYLLATPTENEGEIQRALRWLHDEPGVIRLFQIGYHLLSVLPDRCAKAVYRAKSAQARRPGHLLAREMDEHLGSRRLTDYVSEGAYADAKTLIDSLSSVMDSAACVALRRLIDPVPCFPRVLEPSTGGDRIYVDKGFRHIATMADLATIAAFLGELPSYCGS